MSRNRSSSWLQLGFAVLILLLIPKVILAAPPVILEEGRQKYILGLNLDILEDSAGKWRIEDIVVPNFSPEFQPSNKETPSFGYTTSVYWVRFSIENLSNEGRELLLELKQSFMNRVEFYQFGDDNQISRKISGRRVENRNRDYFYRYHAFRINMAPNSSKQFYMKFENSGPMILPLYLWAPKDFEANVRFEQTILGVYYGIMIVMLIYNMFVYFSLKDNSYLYYVIFIAAMIWYQLNADGLGYQYLWPGKNWMSQYAVTLSWNLSIATYILFSRSFLKTKENTPGIDKILQIFFGLSLGNAVLSQFGLMTLSFQIGFVIQSAGTICLIIISVICIKGNYRPARYYFGAMMAVLVGALSTLLRNGGVIPDSLFTAYGSHLGSAIEVMLLSLGLADRINTISEEKYRAQEAAIQAQKETLENKQIVIQTLEKAEHRINQILNNSIEGIFQFSFDKKLLYANPSMANLFSYSSPKEMINMIEDVEKLVENPQESQEIYQYLMGEETQLDYETQFVRKDQTTFTGMISIQRIEDKIHGDIFAEGMILDVSDRKQKEIAEQNRKIADEANKAKTLFLAQISHELRNPLQGILGYSHLGLTKIESLTKQKTKEYLTLILNSGTRLHGLLNDLLDLSKLEFGKMEFEFDNANLKNCVNTAIEELISTTSDKNISIDFEDPSISDNVMMDRLRMVQVIQNLLSNAIKFSPRNGTIYIRINENRDNFLFSIADQGPGIPNEELESIFENFVQSRKIEAFRGGTGLGLAISKQIIEAHKGKIWAENNLESGATFCFTLPTTPDVEQKA